MSSKHIRYILLVLILLFFDSYCSKDNKLRNVPDIPPDDTRPDDTPKEPKRNDFEKDEDKLKNDYEEKMKENLLLKQQIEDKLKYIKILFVTGVIMLLIIIFILIRICIGRKKKKLIPLEPKFTELKNSKNKSNNKIERSNYNLLNSNSDLSISNTISIYSNNKNLNVSNYNNSNLNEDKRNNLDSAKIEDFSEEKINDDNKTLTNNPDIFISSKTDKMLYQPYSKEEIFNDEKK